MASQQRATQVTFARSNMENALVRPQTPPARDKNKSRSHILESAFAFGHTERQFVGVNFWMRRPVATSPV
jgi:hypothetical protein